ncbi:hypothetical protein OOT00_14025 [Desulfobotulus sp. H1]|uniref:Cell division protein ZapB n=1 Tax=Desulfobotulus pelophilus TaxID=2823377 RepID=A0ABT3NDU5_9BACT|nr:cell division protein ZapB [Desulfobotulus pelophilus]MCW7755102.1 hypothetical protein [Desulfobotulus pelophilus]
MERDVVLSRFDAIESKVERLLAHCRALEEERESLKVELADTNARLEEMIHKDSERVQDEQAMQKKIDALLERLNAF